MVSALTDTTSRRHEFGQAPQAFERLTSSFGHSSADPSEFSAARVGLVATLLAAPFAFGAFDPWAWGLLALAAMALLMVWAAGCARQGGVRLVWSPLYLPAALFILVGAAQFVTGRTLDAVGTRESLIKLVTDLAFFFLALQLFSSASGHAWRRLGLVVTVFASALALFAILQFLSNPNLIYWSFKPRWTGWIFGPYVNHNHYAGLMETLIPLAAGFAFAPAGRTERRALRRISVALALLLPIASLLLSGSRGALVALAAESAIFAWLLARHAPGRRAAVASVLTLAAAAGLFFCLDPGGMAVRFETLVKPADFNERTFGDRRVVALNTLRMFRSHPALGTGLGSFETAYTPYQSFPDDSRWEHAHNDYVEALAETGVVGGAAILLALVLFVRLAFGRGAERFAESESESAATLPGWLQLGAAVGCCGLLVHSLFDFNLHIPANAAWFAACAGWATCRAGRHAAVSRADVSVL